MPRHSKIQLQVLSLYRQFLRTTKAQPSFQEYIKTEFRKHAALPRTDSVKIEYLLRRGWRQLDMLKSSFVTGAGVFEKTENSPK
jgi:succinate dehydrogenase assembly factor 1